MDSRKSRDDTLDQVFPGGSNKRTCYGLNRDNTINVLILGEAGVGKSTWINGIANYVAYGSLTAAQLSNDPKWKIPSRFIISDDDYNEQTIFVGPANGSENEQTKVGESGTMFPQSYEFLWGDKKVRFIDTPGIGDSRGLPQDKINLKNIFDYIEEHQIEDLSAVIILMKPNQKIFTPTFTYIISEIFAHLPKNCAENVLFGFTFTRPFCYRIAETLAPLRQFLVTLKERQNERENYAASWDQSVKETQRFFDRVSSFPPCGTTDIIALNGARLYISMLSKPLALISDMTQLNIESTEAEMKRIKCLDTDSANFERELFKKHKKVYYVCEYLPRPLTVCTSPNHIKMVIDEHGTSQVHYTQECHDPCYLTEVKDKFVGYPDLQNCTAMGGNPNCMVCGCHWSVHMHVNYKLTMHSEMVETVNEDIKRLLIETGDKRKALQVTVDNLVATLEEYKAEKEVIGNIAAIFGAFLKKTAIMPFNDAVEKYINLSIQQAEHIAEMTENPADFEHVETLREWLKRYKQQKHYIEIREANGCTASEVKGYCDQLVNLKHSGRCIKEMFECEKMGMEDREKHMHRDAQSHSAGNQKSHLDKVKSFVSSATAHITGQKK